MRILFITDNFVPEVNAPATRTYEHCKEWVKAGADVTVITCAPNFPQGKVYDGYRNKIYQREKVDGIKVIRVWSYITANKGFFKRTLDYLSFAFSSFWASLFEKTDIIIATSPQFFTTWSAWALSRLKRKPWIFELRDLWPESIRTVGALKENKVLDILEKVELYLYEDADAVIPNTFAFRKNLKSRGVRNKEIHVIPNGANLELFKPQPRSEILIDEQNLSNKFVVGYIGTHGMAHSLDFILHSINHLDDPEIHFLFIGDGAKKEALKRIAGNLELNNVTFLDPVPKNAIPEYLSAIDVSLVPLKKSDTFKTVIPSKIFEASAMKKPVLLGVDGQARELIEHFNAGLYFEPENRTDFIHKLKVLKNDKTLYLTLTEGCVHLAKAFDRRKLAKEMLGLLYKVSDRQVPDQLKDIETLYVPNHIKGKDKQANLKTELVN